MKNGQETVANDDAMLLFSDHAIDETMFNDSNNKWQLSSAQSWCSTFLENVMNPVERDAVLFITKNDPASSNVGTEESPEILKIDQDKVFFLSGKEATLEFYGFATDGNAQDSNRADAAKWWLRSPTIFSEGISYLIGANEDGSLWQYYFDHSQVYARPAFNLDKDSVLFSSKAEGGKASGTTGSSALTAVPANSGKEWKLTLKDSTRNFDINSSACTGGKIFLNYQGANANNQVNAPNEYISAIVKNEFGIITYYGRIARPDETSGQTSIILPDNFDVNKDELYVFSEQYNNDFYTDYASEPVEVLAEENAYSIKTSLTNINSSNKQTYRLFNTDTPYSTTLSANSGFSLPSSIRVMIGDKELSKAEYTYNNGKLSIPANKITDDIEIIAESTKKNHVHNGIPETGDDNNLLLWFAVAAIGVMIMLLVGFVKRRNNS